MTRPFLFSPHVFKPFSWKPLLCAALVLGAAALHAQSPAELAADEGIWHGYDGEQRYASRLLLSIAEAIPAEKYGWRPGPGVRSVSETIMHIAISNYYLLAATGPRGAGTSMPSELEQDNAEKKIGSKPEVVAWLRRSLDAVKTARAQLKPGELQKKVKIEGQSTDVDGMYLRIICHENEHLGQLIAYARVNGIVPPWSAGVVLPK
jgi:uncharacterized damage-inducible protein DinB